MNTVHGPFKQGTAAHTETHRDSGPARGCVSPIGGQGNTDAVISRQEDLASAPMVRDRPGTVPAPNRAAGVTPPAGGRR